MNGEHLWLETNVSGDLCYLGEESCQVKFSVSYFQISFPLSEVTSLTSDWYSAQMLGSLNRLLMLLMLVFQKECKRGKGLLAKHLILWEKSPKQFWMMQIIYTVRMDVRSSFINMVREKRLEYCNISEMFKGSSLFYLCTQIYHLLAFLRVGSDQIFVIWTAFSELLNALTSNECTHIRVFAFSYWRIFEVCFLLLKVFCCV